MTIHKLPELIQMNLDLNTDLNTELRKITDPIEENMDTDRFSRSHLIQI